MTEMSFEKQTEIIDLANDACYLLGMHINTNFKHIVLETEKGKDYIVEVAVITFPKTNKTARNKAIQEYFIEKMTAQNMEFCKLEKHCFINEIYYDLCFKEGDLDGVWF